MFYCEKCRKKKKWPCSLFKSFGACEICGKTAKCYDVHHSQLPLEKRNKKGGKNGKTKHC
jgi:hypothetical protein